MNNIYYDIPNDWYNEFNNNFNLYKTINNKSNFLVNPKIGFEKGNMFNNLYNEYKNYKYNELKPQNNYEDCLYNILKYNFALTDIDIYLDTHPNDSKIINLYNNYLKEYINLINNYETKYGPLTIDSNYLNNNTWIWKNNPWPWEGTQNVEIR